MSRLFFTKKAFILANRNLENLSEMAAVSNVQSEITQEQDSFDKK